MFCSMIRCRNEIAWSYIWHGMRYHSCRVHEPIIRSTAESLGVHLQMTLLAVEPDPEPLIVQNRS